MFKYFEINERGCNIRCKLYYKPKCEATKAVIMCTGFAGHKDGRAVQGFAEKALSKNDGVIIVVFNWPSHGDDVKKKLSLDDCVTYLELVCQYTKAKYGVRELYACATSFGGYLVLKYISEHGNPFARIALRCPAVDMYDLLTTVVMNEDEYDRIMKGKDVQVGFDRKITVTRKLLEELKENDIRARDYLDYAESILILQGTADEVVPFESVRDFAENNLIELVPVQGADHRFQNPVHRSLANKLMMQFFGII